MRVLVTGATGLVGRVVCRHLLNHGFAVRACLHHREQKALLAHLRGPIELHCLGDISANPDWEEPLEGVDVVVHLAARVHVTQDRTADPLCEYRRVNVSATERLAATASQCGVRRLIFASSVKVNGERTLEKPFDEEDPPTPREHYAVSKWEAEQVLRGIAAKTSLEVVLVRPPLVYGPGVQANFLRLMDIVYRGFPLPLPDVKNRRSLIGVENLADFVVRCVIHPSAANQIFLVSDGEDVSTHELATRIANTFGRSCRFFPVPESCLRFAARLLGKEEATNRLLGSLAVSCVKARERLGWNPPVSLNGGLAATSRWYLSSRAH